MSASTIVRWSIRGICTWEGMVSKERHFEDTLRSILILLQPSWPPSVTQPHSKAWGTKAQSQTLFYSSNEDNESSIVIRISFKVPVFLYSREGEWGGHLQKAEFAQNTNVHSSTKQTSLFLANGSKSCLPTRGVGYQIMLLWWARMHHFIHTHTHKAFSSHTIIFRLAIH